MPVVTRSLRMPRIRGKASLNKPRFHVAELMLAVMFLGLFAGLALRTWYGFFFIHGLVMAAVLLFLTYLVLVIMMRQHRRPPKD